MSTIAATAPSGLALLMALTRSRPWVDCVVFPVALAGAHWIVGPQSPTILVAQLATLAAWLVISGAAAEADPDPADKSPIEWRALPPRAGGAAPVTRAVVAASLVLTPSLGAWALPDVDALAAASFGTMGPLALVGGSLLATCVGLAFAADLLERRAPRRRDRTRLRRLATFAACVFGAWAAAAVARAEG